MRTKGSIGLSVEETEKAKQFAGSGMSYRSIGKLLGRSPHTIAKVLTASAQVVEEVKAIKTSLADSFEGLAERMVSSITNEEIKELDAYKRTLSGAIAVDKFKLLRGEPTAILGVEMLLQIAGELRRESAREESAQLGESQHVPMLPAPIAVALPETQQPASRPILAPAPSQKRAVEPPTPQPKIIYHPVSASVHPDHLGPENPLERGLFLRKT
jgi:hypothetical protein